MRTKNFLKHLFLGALLLTTGKVAGQVTTGGNVAAGPTDFLGWNNTFPDNNFPLMVRHDLNQPIEFYTDSILRMKLWHTLGSTINGLTNVRQNGYVGISDQPLFFTTGAGPFSRLHLADSCSDIASQYAQQNGFRRWMRNGITFTGNGDQAYVGHKYNGVNAANDSTDMVIQWSDNAGDVPYGADRLKFIFTDNPLNTSPTATGSKCNEGLEAMRIFIANDSNAFVGVGDWHKATVLNGGATVDPTERLHVNDGTVRIDSLIRDYQNDTLHQVLMSDMQGRVHWRRISTFPAGGGTDCDWTVENDGTSGPGVQHDVYTAEGSSDDCPDATDAVGIGVDLAAVTPVAKLTVISTTYDRGINASTSSASANCMAVATMATGTGTGITYGVSAATAGTAQTAHGIKATADGASYSSFGGAFISDSQAPWTWGASGVVNDGSAESIGLEGRNYANANWNKGVKGSAVASSTAGNEYIGVYGLASTVSSAQVAYGVYGQAPVTMTNNSWAGYFNGDVTITGDGFVNGAIPITSDAQFKTNVEDIEDAMGVIAQLQPRTYEFNSLGMDMLGLPSGSRMGFIAQELEQVLPGLVYETSKPAEHDSTGGLLSEELEYKAVDYIGIIPLLVAAIQEQQARVGALEDALASCCSAGGEGRTLPAGENATGTATTLETDLRIIPNPVADRTELRYTVGTEGRVRLTITAPDGRTIRTQEEGLRAVGTYSYGWDTTALAPGTYHCTLFVNDELVVRKAVKVAVR